MTFGGIKMTTKESIIHTTKELLKQELILQLKTLPKHLILM